MNRKLCLSVLLVVVVLAAGFGVYKYLVWRPHSPLVTGHSYKAVLKWLGTVLLTWPSDMASGDSPVRFADGNLYIVSSSSSRGCRQLLKKFPPPEGIQEGAMSWRNKVVALRSFSGGSLPVESPHEQAPEPTPAVVLLGNNSKKAKYPRLCSKVAKIFVQYLNCLNMPARIVDLHRHTAAEAWNPSENKWELQDPYYDSAARHNGRHLSAAEAHDLTAEGIKLNFKGSSEVFKTVVYIPKLNFADDWLPTWHYFHYDNLDYWKVLRVSEDSWPYWIDRFKDQTM